MVGARATVVEVEIWNFNIMLVVVGVAAEGCKNSISINIGLT